MYIHDAQTIYMLGIGGAGMQGLAHLLHKDGKRILGSDSVHILNRLPANHPYEVLPEESAHPLITHADIVIHTDAAQPSHLLLQDASTQNIPVIPYHKALGQYAKDKDVIAVAGTHGKSSTTAFLAHIFMDAGYDPSVLIGARMPSLEGGGARKGESAYFIVEADEYRNHFLSLPVSHGAITSIDFDHPDFFSSLEDVVASYSSFVQSVRDRGIVATPSHVAKAHPDIPWPQTTLQTHADARTPMPLPGEHMQSNAAIAIALATSLGVSEETAIQALSSFPGLERRFERLGMCGSLEIISDYAHHPSEISATLAAARHSFPNKRILALFEAHTTKRLTVFKDEFAESLKGADGVLLIPPFIPSGREDAGAQADMEDIFNLLQGSVDDVAHVSLTTLVDALKTRTSSYDIVIALTAGELDTALRTVVQVD